MNTLQDRAARQRDIVPPERLAMCRATVVGVGAIGRQVALQLAAMGILHLQLIDPDRVEVVNLAPQGYFEDDVGLPKVQATAGLCHRMHIGLEIHEHCERFRRSMDVGNVLFNCVDDIEVRRIVWESTQDRLGFYADGRMSAEVIRVLVAALLDAAIRRPVVAPAADAPIRTFGLPPCAQKMLAAGVDGYQRVACFRLAVHLKLAGIPQDLALPILKTWACKNHPEGKQTITPAEIDDQVQSAYAKPYRSCGCEDSRIKAYCDPSCPLFKQRDRSGRLGATPIAVEGSAQTSQNAVECRPEMPAEPAACVATTGPPAQGRPG